MSSRGTSEHLHVVIVEDNPADRYLLRGAIHTAHPQCDFHVFDRGDDALQYLFREGPHADAPAPDIIVLDLNLPGLNGQEVLETIRGTPELGKLTVVICSSAPKEAAKQVSEADAYIRKPDELDAFLDIGTQILACYRARRGRREPNSLHD